MFFAAILAFSTLSQQPLVIRDYLVLPSVGAYGRSPLHRDPIQLSMANGEWKNPAAGQKVVGASGNSVAWREVTAKEDGSLDVPEVRGGYAFARVTSEVERAALLEASGHSMVYVNGEPRAGDVYGNGLTVLPIHLKRGENTFLFAGGRGAMRASILEAPARVYLTSRDVTLPDLLLGEPGSVWIGVIVINAGDMQESALRVSAQVDAGTVELTTVPSMLPFSIHKAAVRVHWTGKSEQKSLPIKLTLQRMEAGKWIEGSKLDLQAEVKSPFQVHKRTFVSGVDGSVQYYAVNPASGTDSVPKALALSCHGAGVEAIGQANAYGQKAWMHLVAATNRRPFGFDWEDWGRLDAMEVLRDAKSRLDADERRIYLTGHSMGGHGTWHLGVTFPDQFAAIGPSAGWVSFWTYAGGARFSDAGIPGMFTRAASQSDTLGLVRNLTNLGVYVLHGDADDNVPVDQARTMTKALAEFHKDFMSHEQAGAGHWWDASEEPGADCVDWAPMMDFFARRSRPHATEVRRASFTTVNPGSSANYYWVRIEQQQSSMKPSRVDLAWDPNLGRISGKTENVAMISFDPSVLDGADSLRFEVDGQTIAVPRMKEPGRYHFAKGAEGWKASPPPAESSKRPDASGPFKNAFQNRMIFVYGTAGTDHENAWSISKARFDAESFWYRGNATPQVISDAEFVSKQRYSRDLRGRNVILYGNAQTNGAWKTVVGESEIIAKRNRITIGSREFVGPDNLLLACLPSRSDPGCLVAVIAPAGMPAAMLSVRMPTFVSGVAYPDVCVISTESLQSGIDGVLCAGFLGNDWAVSSGEFAYRD